MTIALVVAAGLFLLGLLLCLAALVVVAFDRRGRLCDLDEQLLMWGLGLAGFSGLAGFVVILVA